MASQAASLKRQEYDNAEEYYAKEPWSMLRNLAFHASRDFSFMEEIAPLDCRMLDYGAGVGYFTRAALAYDKLAVDVIGINTEFLAASIGDIEIAGAPYTPQTESWDLVVCVDVLEHIEEPIDILNSLLNGLKLGGKFLYYFATALHDAGHISVQHASRCDQIMLDNCILRSKHANGRYALYERSY